MAKKETIFSTSTVTHVGVFSFPKFYKFCNDWIMSEIEPTIFNEPNYSEKIIGDGKDIDIVWKFQKKFTNYFRFDGKIKFKTSGMKKVELEKDSKKINANQGEVVMKIDGELVSDYENKFDNSKAMQTWRNIYEKWIIKSRVDHFEGRVDDYCNRLMEEAKAFLELEGNRG